MNDDGLIPLLGCPVPASLVEACGYRGAARYLGFRWTRGPDGAGEIVAVDDGFARQAGEAWVWWVFIRHRVTYRYVRPFALERGRQALLLDRTRLRWYVGPHVAVTEFVRCAARSGAQGARAAGAHITHFYSQRGAVSEARAAEIRRPDPVRQALELRRLGGLCQRLEADLEALSGGGQGAGARPR